ncbi:hypothetical protein OFO01_07150 [Campylobacter sp. JMF_01 NE2]|uniref:hypothetical protein n=1 Tax=unclassified Campylobacter TaxID=2593542 RepID=UPI0022E9CCF3|nr:MULTISPECIES: hypothetical protein [unclassified Campylobacter]MDA3053260.1 hypothetical protein [Campylobacter sp. JMF_03 NE3]MDA3067557.1 hypothetical protein [Campylobacter sp. JMF_01 NE2]
MQRTIEEFFVRSLAITFFGAFFSFFLSNFITTQSVADFFGTSFEISACAFMGCFAMGFVMMCVDCVISLFKRA